MSEQCWVVMDGERSVAAYRSEGLADEHARAMGLYVVTVPLLAELPTEVTDPAAQSERDAASERERARLRARERYEHEQYEAALRYRIVDALERGGRPKLCTCATFNRSTNLITDNGYCRYCGGFTPEVFRLHCGEDALFEAIELLAHHDRTKMRELVGLRRDDWPTELTVK